MRASEDKGDVFCHAGELFAEPVLLDGDARAADGGRDGIRAETPRAIARCLTARLDGSIVLACNPVAL